MATQTDLRYDVFISYADDDRAWVNGYLLDVLNQAGVHCLTESAFALGVPKLLEFQRAVQQSKRILLVLSPAYVTDQTATFVDVLAEGYGLETSTWPVIPLILHPVKLPIRLSTLTSLDMTEPDQQRAGLDRLLADLQHPQVPELAAPPACPYPGMEPFNETNSARFFGRDPEIQESLNRLRLHPFLTYIGPSGSGKSSLVMAGLIPALHQSSLFGDGKWLIRTLRPGEAPLNALADRLGGDASDPLQGVGALLAQEPGARLLLVVDQFEEIFTFARSSIPSFPQALLKLSQTPNCYVVLTARADFYPDLMALAPLWPEIQAHRLEVSPLDDDGLRQAIIRPAEAVGVYVEAALVERLIVDTAGEPGILPLLQETLRLLWDRMERRYLPLRAYETLVLSRKAYGPTTSDRQTGLQVAIASRANSALADLTPEQQALARRIFLRLVQFGEGREDTRRQQSMDALQLGSDPAVFTRTIEHLVANRLLIVSGDETGPHRQVDIAHEALIRAWPTLQEWLRENRVAEQVHRRLENKTLEWLQLGHGAGGLLDEVELAEADRWLASPDAAIVGYSHDLKDFVDTSRSALQTAREDKEHAQQYRSRLERRAKNLARFIAGSLAVLCSILAVLAAYAYSQRGEAISNAQMAQTNAAVADANARDALSRLLASQSLLNVKGQPDLAALLSLYAGSSKDTFEARSSLLNVLQLNGHFAGALENRPSAIYSLAYHARTDQLALGGDGVITLWNVDRRQPIGPPLQNEKPAMRIVRSLAFNADGTLLVSGGDDGVIHLWDLVSHTSSTLVPPDNTKMGTVYSVAFGCDGAFLASGTDDGLIRLWDVQTRQLIDSPLNPVKIGSIRSLAFSHTGCLLAAGDTNGDVKLWDVNGRQPIELPRKHSNWVLSLAFSPDDKVLVSGGADRQIILWDMEKYEPIGAPLNAGNWVRSLAFSAGGADSSLLASGGDDATILLWDWQAVRQRKTTHPVTFPLTGHSGGIYGLAFAHDDQLLISGAVDRQAMLWRIDSRIHTLGQTLDHIDQVHAICFASASQTVVIGQADGAIMLWDIAGQQKRALNTSGTPVQSLACSPDGKTFVSGDSAGSLLRWDIATGQSGPFSNAHNGAVQALAYRQDGGALASGGDDGRLFLWDPANPQSPPVSLMSPSKTFTINSLAFSPDGATLASGDSQGSVLLWTVQTRAVSEVQKIASGSASSVAFSPDGNILAFGGNDGQIRLWDVKNRSLLGAPLQGHDGRFPVNSLAFSPDGLILASGAGDNSTILWDLGTHLPLGLPLTGYSGPVRGLAFSAGSGRWLASGSDGYPGVILWDLDREVWRQDACAIAHRALTPEEKGRFLGSMTFEREPCQ